MGGCEWKPARSASAIARSLNITTQPINEMIRHYAAMGLQLLGLIVTGEALLLYFGDMGPLMKTASLGAGLFYVGRFIRPRTGK
jgi:hypothetical protein